jgi:hypothetical protein
MSSMRCRAGGAPLMVAVCCRWGWDGGLQVAPQDQHDQIRVRGAMRERVPGAGIRGLCAGGPCHWRTGAEAVPPTAAELLRFDAVLVFCVCFLGARIPGIPGSAQETAQAVAFCLRVVFFILFFWCFASLAAVPPRQRIAAGPASSLGIYARQLDRSRHSRSVPVESLMNRGAISDVAHFYK